MKIANQMKIWDAKLRGFYNSLIMPVGLPNTREKDLIGAYQLSFFVVLEKNIIPGTIEML